MDSLKIIKGNIFNFNSESTLKKIKYEYIENGAIIIKNGKIKEVLPFDFIDKEILKYADFEDFTNNLIMSGFVDTHIHYPQVDIIASYGEQLLEWLDKYTFPHESKFLSKDFSQETSEFFVQELFRNGTTTAMVFCTTHRNSVEAFFETANKYNLRMIAGKVNMDRNAPKLLLESKEDGIKNTKALIKKWHKKNRLNYAITPRFAPTSTEEQLKYLGEIVKENPDIYIQSHLSENLNEITWVKELFPNNSGYLDVYNDNNLLTENSVYAHCIHLSEQEFNLFKEKGAAISFCPSSNLFIGSGLFNYEKVKNMEIPLGIASDIGGGTSFSILKNLGDAYKICQLKGQNFSSLEAFFIATLGGAKALKLDRYIGNLDIGKEADLIVLDLEATPLMKRRNLNINNIEDKLFMLMTLGGEENVKATYILGNKVFEKN
ncbi:MAG: guanine deaminase [Fusobacteriaceae bacterium]|nr:guanine deaminase [Fusobacteriaceae bacterium]